MSRERKRKTPELGDQFDHDMEWVTLMNNRNFLSTLMRTVIKDSGKKNISFRGAFLYGTPGKDISELIDTETIDLVFPGKEKIKKTLTKQSIFTSVESFIKHRKPLPNKCNIYLAADLYGSGQYISTHWNSFILDLRDPDYKYLVKYDPSEDMEVDEEVYNFDQKKRNNIIKVMEDYTNDDTITLRTNQRAQQFCAEHAVQDVFCQSWVVLFASVYINNCFEDYSKINFIKWQTQPIKLWLTCMATKMPKSWQPTLQTVLYYNFFTYCRRYKNESRCSIVEKVPTIIDKRKGRGKSNKHVPCVYSLLTHYLGLKKLYSPPSED